MADQTVLRGLTEAYSLMDQLPTAAEKELARDLTDIGGTILVAQQARAPVASTARPGDPAPGALRSSLSIKLLLDEMKVRVGLIGVTSRRSRKTNLGGAFYGVIVNFGRKAQVVTVTRRIKARRITGNGKTSKRKVTYLAASYSMKVRAMDPREFIDVTADIGAEIDAKEANFWARTFSQLPGGDQ